MAKHTHVLIYGNHIVNDEDGVRHVKEGDSCTPSADDLKFYPDKFAVAEDAPKRRGRPVGSGKASQEADPDDDVKGLRSAVGPSTDSPGSSGHGHSGFGNNPGSKDTGSKK